MQNTLRTAIIVVVAVALGASLYEINRKTGAALRQADKAVQKSEEGLAVVYSFRKKSDAEIADRLGKMSSQNQALIDTFLNYDLKTMSDEISRLKIDNAALTAEIQNLKDRPTTAAVK